ncbi:hypothetical protein THAOC_02025, partial [Thalassiosira oceanica]
SANFWPFPLSSAFANYRTRLRSRDRVPKVRGWPGLETHLHLGLALSAPLNGGGSKYSRISLKDLSLAPLGPCEAHQCQHRYLINQSDGDVWASGDRADSGVDRESLASYTSKRSAKTLY